MAQQQQAEKTAGARQRGSEAARRVALTKLFFGGLIALLLFILVYQNWQPVPISVFGISFVLPGTLWYVLIFACGALVGLWLQSRRRAQ